MIVLELSGRALLVGKVFEIERTAHIARAGLAVVLNGTEFLAIGVFLQGTSRLLGDSAAVATDFALTPKR